jgi:hypothetical protein
MTVPRIVVALLIAISLTSAQFPLNDADCNGFEFKTEVTKVPNQDFFKLTITASGGSKPYRYVLLDNKNNLVSTDFETNVYSSLKQGDYRCIVADRNDCTKEQIIEVK